MVRTCRELARGISTYVVGEDKKTQDKKANCARLIKAYTLSVKLSCRKTEATQYNLLMDFLTTSEPLPPSLHCTLLASIGLHSPPILSRL